MNTNKWIELVNNMKDEDYQIEKDNKMFNDETIEQIIKLQNAEITGFVVCNLYRSYFHFTRETIMLKEYYETYIGESFIYEFNLNCYKNEQEDDLITFSPRFIYECINNQIKNFTQYKIPIDIFRQGLFRIKKMVCKQPDSSEYYRYYEDIFLLTEPEKIVFK
jgi:hypothetical protein